MSTNDKKINELLKTVEEARNKLGEKPQSKYITSKVLKLHTYQQATTINFNILRTEEQILEVCAMLFKEKNALQEAAKFLGTNGNEKFLINGFTVTEWLEDLKVWYEELVYKEKLKNLQSMEAKLQAMYSEDAKTSNALNEMNSLLAKF